jgi:hypothetical protein
MRRLVILVVWLVVVAAAVTSMAFADASAPTNGGSNLGGGQSGTCTGALADRPADCGK